jgi:hypothetical protein
MTVRIVAVILGIAGCVAAIFLLSHHWENTLGLLPIPPDLGAALSLPSARFPWTISAAAEIFVAVTLLFAVIGGWTETVRTRGRINVLRYDPNLSGRWSAADWRAAFARTAIANRAEAIVAAISPAGDERRVVTDLGLLSDLETVWLDRLIFRGMITPLPPLVLGFGATLALLRYSAGEGGWETALAAGAGGWLAISLTYYIARLSMSPATQLTVDAAIAAMRPLTAALSQPIATAGGAPSDDREVSIEIALNEVRASIERLLAAKS